MGRKSGITALHLIVLGVLALVAVVSVMTYTNLAHVSLHFGGRATPAHVVRRPLVELALAVPEIQDALGISSSLVLGSSTRLCDIPRSIECYQAEYASSDGDQVVLLLSRFTSPDDAVDFGLRMKYQLEDQQKVTEILARVDAGSFRWLDRSQDTGNPTVYGGANEGSIAVDFTWQSARLLSDEDAPLTFSSLLDAQFKKLGAAR